MREELIEYIFMNIHEECLSDLRLPKIFRKHRDFILGIKEDSYSLQEWNRLIDYICQPSRQAETIKEAKDMLLEWSNQIYK